MQRRSGLGRGLDALIPVGSDGRTEGPFREVPIGAVVPNRYQPREAFDDELLASLAASIRELGVLQPILVRAVGDDQYELIAGERRWRAAKRAGLTTIPAIIRTVDDQHSLEQALVENLHRQDLNALEEASAYQQLMEDFGLTQDAVAVRVGKSRSAVANTLRLLQLPPAVQRLLVDGVLSAGHGRALLAVTDRGQIELLARRAADEELTVRQVEDLVRRGGETETGAEPDASRSASPETGPSVGEPGRTREPAVLELEQLLAARLDTRVHVNLGSGKGKIVVEFADLDDLERIYRIITPPGTSVAPVDEH